MSMESVCSKNSCLGSDSTNFCMAVVCFSSQFDLSPVSSVIQHRMSPVMYSFPFEVAWSREVCMTDSHRSTQ